LSTTVSKRLQRSLIMVLSVLYRLKSADWSRHLVGNSVPFSSNPLFWTRRFSHLMDRAWLPSGDGVSLDHLMDRSCLTSIHEWANSRHGQSDEVNTLIHPCSSLILNGNLSRSSTCVRDMFFFSSKSFEYAYMTPILLLLFFVYFKLGSPWRLFLWNMHVLALHVLFFNLFLDSAKEHVCTHTSMSNKS
jgi:hypothetical protein